MIELREGFDVIGIVLNVAALCVLVWLLAQACVFIYLIAKGITLIGDKVMGKTDNGEH